MEKFSVLFHPCENLDDYVGGTTTFRPLYTHHFFTEEDSCPALQWVRYDVYYIVDTFELFIKVTGQVHTAKDENEIRKALYVVYKSVYTSLPEHTLILEESTFKHLLYMRSIGTKKFVPPGRIVAEVPLDSSSIFQLRYCVFNETNTAQNTVEHSKALYKKADADDAFCPFMADEPVYFRNTLDKEHFDAELYAECASSISHKGNFDNCLVYEIIKHINKGKRGRARSPRTPEYDRLNFAIQDNFNILHRRLEWFYHWFIEGASNIKPDPRWAVFVPLIVSTYDQFEFDHMKTQNELSNALTSNAELRKAVEDRLAEVDRESIRAAVMAQPLGVITDLKNDRPNRSPLSKKLNNPNKQYNVTILGMVTAYYFFTLNHDRLRVSQFLIFPNYGGKGFGLWVLEFIYRMAIMDSHVREITVEDPTEAFLALRYIVALKLCFESGLMDPKVLYGNDRKALAFLTLLSKAQTPSRDRISAICKESKSHSTRQVPPTRRLAEILQLGNMLPHPISSDFFVNRLSNKRQRSNAIGNAHARADVKLSLFVQSDGYIEFCDRLKSKLRVEELRAVGKNGAHGKGQALKNANSVGAAHAQLDALLENLCNQTVYGYIRVINKLRKIFPKE